VEGALKREEKGRGKGFKVSFFSSGGIIYIKVIKVARGRKLEVKKYNNYIINV